ncbi:MAG TPA: helix-turn-helix domain-containing protein [Solirubrobacteraceae bacterium]|jgi:transcriptional regulator with XRE-family HTH domain
MTPSNADLGRAIRRLRRRRAMTIDDLAFEAKMHPTYLSGIERGVRNPTYDKLCGLSKALDVGLPEIMKDAMTEAEIDARMREVRQAMWLDSLKQDPPTDITSEEIVQSIHEGRAERDAQVERAISDEGES